MQCTIVRVDAVFNFPLFLFEYSQQLMDLVKVLQEKLIEEKRKMQTLEVKIREEVCQEMAEQLVSIEKAYR